MNKIVIIAAVCMLSVPIISHARLVIVQDDSILMAKQKEKETKLKAQAVQEQEDKRKQLLLENERKVRNATVDFQKNEYNVIADRTEKVIKHFGLPPKQLPALGGAALDSPFWIAMNAIVPTGWKVFMDKSVDAQIPVNWSGQRYNWVAILHQLGVQKRLSFDVDWNQQVVLVRPRTSSIDYLREQHKTGNNSQDFLITVDADSSQAIPEGGEGVLVINGQPVKVKRTERLIKAKN